MTCFVSIPSLMIFSATLRLDGLLLLGHPDRPEAAFAYGLEQLVASDDRPGRLAGGRLRLVQEGLGPFVGPQELVEAGVQLGVALALFGQELGTLVAAALHGAEEQCLDPVRIGLGCHGCFSVRDEASEASSVWASQALA